MEWATLAEEEIDKEREVRGNMSGQQKRVTGASDSSPSFDPVRGRHGWKIMHAMLLEYYVVGCLS